VSRGTPEVPVQGMTDPAVITTLHAALVVAAKLSAPPLLASLVSGVVISLLQAVTQINEATISFLPKIAAVVGTLMIMGGFLFSTLAAFAHQIFSAMIHVG
jgi:flagellar biosynthetic protein FliQ